MDAVPAPLKRLRLQVRGTVQGVGFRPFVFRLAQELGIAGWIENDAAGVVIEAEAAEPALDRFRAALRAQAPPHAAILELGEEWVAATLQPGFEIRASAAGGTPTALVLPDLASCDACRRELHDRADRRHGYAFTNCTHCGPRFSIIRALPYDRPHTTMAGFVLCPACRGEYQDPGDRRFHAQPNACPQCGPHLQLLGPDGGVLVAHGDDRTALLGTAAAIADGRIAAVKGIGGFLLLCDAGNAAAVQTLRDRKHRPTRAFALMVPDLDAAALIAEVDAAATAALLGADAPIVLLPRRPGAPVVPGVAPGNPYLGIMLPYAPLLHLLLEAVRRPVVATSGNLSDEPICTAGEEALARLHGIADVFLTHDRPIQRHVDDSVAWIVAGEVRLLRRARGHAPRPIRLAAPVPPLLAVGAHLKNAVAVARGHDVFISQHIGDLETHESQRAFATVIADLLSFYDVRPAAVAHDLHPDYAATQWARSFAAAAEPSPVLVGVQHHHAHLASCLAEHGEAGPALGIIWDGTGLGADGTIWGGEFLLGDAAGFERVAHFRPLRLPGGDAAVVEPARVALSLLHQLYGDEAATLDLPVVRRIPEPKRHALLQLLAGGFNSPLSSSAGRLFDGVAALLDLGDHASFEGEVAMALEFAVTPGETGRYPLPLAPQAVLDWRPLLADLLADVRAGVERGRIAARFHNALVHAGLVIAERVGQPRVALSGGCFQNRVLTERLAAVLRGRGFQVLQHRQVPPNDGGVALGQVMIAAARLRAAED
ncbi:MAG: carbamoyltransferase HypF [Gemmatimonadetes bacterium]|nr:carbamoyltransferase HypF [Gemmatimonadota bacterium]